MTRPRAYVIASGIRIAPFGELAAELPIGGVPLAERQRALLERAGLTVTSVASLAEVPRDARALVTFDNVFFTRRLLKDFLRRWPEGRSVQLALPEDAGFVRRFSALQDLQRREGHALFHVFGLDPADWPAGPITGRVAEDRVALGAVRGLPVIYAERALQVPVPPRITGRATWEHPLTSSVCFHVRHWLHVLQASLLSIQIEWIDTIVTRPWVGLGILLRSLFHRGGWGARIGAAANRFGRGVQIHPTARVEGSIIGDRVRIGPQALVRGAIIGADSILEQRVDVSYSVLGRRSFVSKHSLLWATVGFDEAELCMKGMQMCLVGKGASLTARATPLDVTPGRALRVRDGDRFVEIDLDVLGACFGHRCFIGADVFTAPGREIPNGTRILPDPARVLSRVPADLDPAKAYVVRGGSLEPIE